MSACQNGAVDETMISKDEHYSLAMIELEEGSFSERQDAYVDLRQEVREGDFEVVAAGEMPLNEDFERVTERDLKRAETVSLPLAQVGHLRYGPSVAHARARDDAADGTLE